jgi:hypothetical protein
MKQIVGILFLLFMLKLTSSGQSRILTGTLTAAPNTSTTILPYIVKTKTPDVQKDDSALFNPRYVPPPPVDSSTFNTNTPATPNNNGNVQTQNGGTVESTYQYKTPDPKPYVDGDNGSGAAPQSATYQPTNQVTDSGTETYQYKTPGSQPLVDSRRGNRTYTPPASYKTQTQVATPPPTSYQSQNQSDPNAETYQYKTLDEQPVVDNRKTISSRSHYPKRVASKPNSTSEILDKNSFETNPASLAASEDYGNTTAKTTPKWTPKKTWKKDTITINETKPFHKVVTTTNTLTPTLAVNNNNLTPRLTVTPKGNVVVPAKANTAVSSAPTVVSPKWRARKKPTPSFATTDVSQQPQQEQPTSNADYKLIITPDGKYTLVFYNNGGSVTVTEFGRILSVTTPTSGQLASPQYDYRGLLESVGNLPLQYNYEGRLLSVGSTVLGYNYNGNIQSIGNTALYYNSSGTIDKVGNTKVQYDANGNVIGIGGTNPIIVMKQ